MATVFGSLGADTLAGDTTNDLISGGPFGNEAADTGRDSLNGTAGNDTLLGWGGNDTLDGGTGTDQLDGGDGDDRLLSDGDGGAGEGLVGGAGNDRFILTALPRDADFDWVIIGDFVAGAGGEVLDLSSWGVADFATLLTLGYGGGDWGIDVRTNNAIDRLRLDGVNEASLVAANFVLSTANTDDIISGAAGGDDLFGGLGNDSVSGAAGNDQLFGEQGNDTLDGGAGSDTMRGGDGDDTYYVDLAADQTLEDKKAGTDTVLAARDWILAANVENLTLLGSAKLTGKGNGLDNLLIGNDGQNKLVGAGGSDTIDGGAGKDKMVGGNGADAFSWSVLDGAKDKVGGFVSGTDEVHIAASAIGNLLPTGTIGIADFALNAPTASAPQFIYDTTNGLLSFDDDGVGGHKATTIAVLAGVPAIAASDIVIV